jgi:dsRNA-specific ribonuclease
MFWPILWLSAMAVAVLAYLAAIYMDGAKKRAALKVSQERQQSLASQAGSMEEFPVENLDFPEESLT